MKITHRLLGGLAAFAVLSSVLYAQESGVSELRVYPANVSLRTGKDRQLVVVQAVYENGLTRDVSQEAEFTLAQPDLIDRDGNVLRPAADGETELKVAFAGQTVTVPVKIEQADAPRPVSYSLDVMPAFMKAGCNSGSCHGAARGKDGFMLSLFGYDPDGDHFRLTQELPGRRIDYSVPEASLLVEKAVGEVPHTGGKRFDRDSEIYKDLVEWVAADCPNDGDKAPACTSIEIYPKQAVLDGAGATQQVTVRAFYSDGTTRDVTSLALFLSNNDNSATISDDGLVTADNRGEAFIMARFATHTVGSQYIVLPKGLEFTYPDTEPVNYIDELVDAKLKKLRMTPSEVCSDEAFLRRIYLDLVGLLPTVEQYEGFLADGSPDKRSRLIDELLERKEFSEIWVGKWAEWLAMRSSNRVSYKATLLYYNWLADQIADNVPLDKMVQQILGASGGTFKVPATNFYEYDRNTLQVAENVAQVFMGMRIQCAQCHNHPFDRWTQDDYYGFAAFFAQIGRKTGEDYRETIVYNRGGGSIRHPVNNRVMEPKFLGGDVPDVRGKDQRVVLAKWLASPDNPYFAANFANRVWDHFFGLGIIEPVDDVRISNPASNPELLDELAKRFTESNYDFKALVRDICNSKTYQRSTERNESNKTDELNFAHANLRRIKAESLLDCIGQVTNTQEKFRGLPLGARAVQIADGGTTSYFLTTFGRASRETVCSCEVRMEPTLSQALHLLNGSTVSGKISQGKVLDEMLAQKMSPQEIVENLYIRTLTRKPTAEELDNLSSLFGEGSDPKQALTDIFWALLNSREFIFNH
jgi:hypothetical protein